MNIGVKIKTIAMDTSGRLWIGTEERGFIVWINPA
ncbi:MAG: hypothetical protein IPP49_16980 [Saprospiraceae bacterium]|nr:hypothetical protein [Saprospiraceae bacterium]